MEYLKLIHKVIKLTTVTLIFSLLIGCSTVQEIFATPMPTPTGPANVIASMPPSISCEQLGGGECIWIIEVTFTETNGVDATVEKIEPSIVDGDKNVWTTAGWNVDIFIPAYQSKAFKLTQRYYPNFGADIRGSTMRISYRGTDANGFHFNDFASTTTLVWSIPKP